MGSGLSGAIIAAGTGSRLRTASAGVPKPLVTLDGEPLLQRQLRMLELVGAAPINFIINSETAQLMAAAALCLPAKAAMLVRDTPNSMESLLALGEHIPTGRFLLMTVDTIIKEIDLAEFVNAALRRISSIGASAVDGVLGMVRWRGDKHPLFAQMADDGRLLRLGAESGDLVTAGIYLFSTSIFKFAAEARQLKLDAMRRYLAFLLERGIRFAGIPLTNAIDVDEGEDLRAARAFLGLS